jgi:hypothetical protein
MTSQEAWDEIPQEFHAWWDSGDKSGTPGNPFYLGSPAFWAWEGWRAAAKAEREACAQRAKPMALDIKPPNEEGATMCAGALAGRDAARLGWSVGSRSIGASVYHT